MAVGKKEKRNGVFDTKTFVRAWHRVFCIELFALCRRIELSLTHKHTKVHTKIGIESHCRLPLKFQTKMPHFKNYFDYIWHCLSNMRVAHSSATQLDNISLKYIRKCVDKHQDCWDKIRTRSTSIPEQEHGTFPRAQNVKIHLSRMCFVSSVGIWHLSVATVANVRHN